ncbi:cytosine permease [Bacillus sp. OV166]|uniref:cytosine permease n=1 Tax=Bacillus sp. OV166 TaxID=1882763 RepID=UPI0015C516E8|nr:cytosine permease [Bacillus sp. OV166]
MKREYKTVFNGVALKVPANKLSNFESFILLLSYFMVPWTAINLIDYYLLRRGEYNVWDVFDVNGQYGKFNWVAIMTYLVSFILEIPFVNTTMYVGPVSKALDGTDIA